MKKEPTEIKAAYWVTEGGALVSAAAGQALIANHVKQIHKLVGHTIRVAGRRIKVTAVEDDTETRVTYPRVFITGVVEDK